MATGTITGLSGTAAINFFTDFTLQNLLYDQTANSVSSPDGLSVTYTFANDTLTLHSLDGLDLYTFTGTITGISTANSSIADLNILYRDFAIAVGNADADAVNALVWGGNDTIDGGASNDQLRGFGGNDLIYGNGGNDMLLGYDGLDRLFGGSGDDRLIGGTGNDRLDGGTGKDRLLGGAGDDRIIGGQGLDNVYGGSGADTFIFNKISDFSAYDPSGVITFDIIRDFKHAQGDLINLQQIDANTALTGNQTFQFIGASAFAENTPGTVNVEKFARSIYLVRLNTDNDAAPEATLIVITAVTLADPAGIDPVAADFLL